MSIRAAAVASVVLLTACGARTEIEPTTGIDGAGGDGSTSLSTTSSTTSTTSTDATSSTSSTGAGPVCTTLGAPTQPALALTDPSGDALLTSLLAEGSQAFVASANNNDPSPDPSWRVRRVSADLSDLGASEIVAKHPQSVSFSGMSLASQGDHRGGLFWDESHGCRFVAINGDGSAGASTEIDPTTWCYGLTATESGYYAFMAPSFEFMPLVLVQLDASGTATDKISVFASAEPGSYPRGRATLSDGTVMLAYSKGNAYFTTRISLDGKVVTPPKSLVMLGDHPRFALTPAGDHALAVWTSDHAPGDILVASIDAEGVAKSVSFVGHAAPPIGDATIRQYGDGALVAWSGSTEDAVKVVKVGPAGEILTKAITVDAPSVPHDLRVAPTDFGAIVGFGALDDGLTQVFVSALPCVAE